MFEENLWLYLIGGLVVLMGIFMINKRRKIDEQVRRVKKANEPGYRAPKDNMEMSIKDGVVTYRKRGKK
jgi:hypothetical protein